MAAGPRLEFRQTQSLVMTPQLRQAIKLLQFTNLEAAAFVEEELERNPLLERDERTEALPERPAPDQLPEGLSGLDAATLLRREKLPDAVDADHANTFDAGGLSDGAFAGTGAGAGGGLGFDGDERGIDDVAEAPRNLRAHLGEQLRLGFADPRDRLIGAHLIALLDPAGFVVGGGVGEAGELLLGPARATLAERLTGRDHRPQPDVSSASLGNDAGMVGAADLARHAMVEPPDSAGVGFWPRRRKGKRRAVRRRRDSLWAARS